MPDPGWVINVINLHLLVSAEICAIRSCVPHPASTSRVPEHRAWGAALS